jgi:hypothetical protein
VVSTINYGVGQTRANNAIVLLGPGGTITASSSGRTDACIAAYAPPPPLRGKMVRECRCHVYPEMP